MSQLVREPTRDDCLLDLVITDICKCIVIVLPCIVDHNSLLAKLPTAEVLERIVKRDVWTLKDVDWKIRDHELHNYDWKRLQEGSAEDSFRSFLEILWLYLMKYIS